MKILFKTNQNGSMLIVALVLSGLFLVITTGAISLALMQRKLNINNVASAQALHVAEAGAEQRPLGDETVVVQPTQADLCSAPVTGVDRPGDPTEPLAPPCGRVGDVRREDRVFRGLAQLDLAVDRRSADRQQCHDDQDRQESSVFHR